MNLPNPYTPYIAAPVIELIKKRQKMKTAFYTLLLSSPALGIALQNIKGDIIIYAGAIYCLVLLTALVGFLTTQPFKEIGLIEINRENIILTGLNSKNPQVFPIQELKEVRLTYGIGTEGVALSEWLQSNNNWIEFTYKNEKYFFRYLIYELVMATTIVNVGQLLTEKVNAEVLNYGLVTNRSKHEQWRKESEKNCYNKLRLG